MCINEDIPAQTFSREIIISGELGYPFCDLTHYFFLLLDSLVVECWLRVREVLDSRTASYQRRYKNGTSSSLVSHSTFKRENTGSFSRIKMRK